MYEKGQLNTIAWDIFTTSFWHILAKTIGFFIPVLIASLYGINQETDALFLAYSIIWTITVISSSIGSGIAVPFIAEKSAKNEDINLFINNILSYTITILLTFFIILFCAFKPLIAITTAFDSITNSLIFNLTLILSPTAMFLTAGGFIEGLLNYHRKFWIPCIALAIRSCVILISILFLKLQFGIYSIAFAYIAGEFIYFLLLLITTKKILNFSLKWNLGNKTEMFGFLKVAFFQTAYISFVGINHLINKTMASYVGIGSVTILEYSEKIYFIFYNLLPFVFSKVLLTHWSVLFYEQQVKELKNHVIKMAKLILLISIPICIILYFLKDQITELVFLRGNFPISSISITSKLVGLQMILLIPSILNIVFTKYILVLKATKVLFLISIARTIINIIGNIIGIKLFGLAGILLSTIFQFSLVSIVLFIIIMKLKTSYPQTAESLS